MRLTRDPLNPEALAVVPFQTVFKQSQSQVKCLIPISQRAAKSVQAKPLRVLVVFCGAAPPVFRVSSPEFAAYDRAGWLAGCTKPETQALIALLNLGGWIVPVCAASVGKGAHTGLHRKDRKKNNKRKDIN